MAGAGFDAVIHFAALKAVGESTAKPLEYYDTNIGSLLGLLFAMRTHGVKKLGALLGRRQPAGAAAAAAAKRAEDHRQ